MTVPVLIDMNLSPEWVTHFASSGIASVHWSTIGNDDSDDATIMEWARTNGYAVFTHDLDFGTALALTHAMGPSVIQIRGKKVLPELIGSIVISTIATYQTVIAFGALIVIDGKKSRVRILPF